MSSGIFALDHLERGLCVIVLGDSPPACRPGREQPHLQLPGRPLPPAWDPVNHFPPPGHTGTQGVWCQFPDSARSGLIDLQHTICPSSQPSIARYGAFPATPLCVATTWVQPCRCRWEHRCEPEKQVVGSDRFACESSPGGLNVPDALGSVLQPLGSCWLQGRASCGHTVRPQGRGVMWLGSGVCQGARGSAVTFSWCVIWEPF